MIKNPALVTEYVVVTNITQAGVKLWSNKQQAHSPTHHQPAGLTQLRGCLCYFHKFHCLYKSVLYLLLVVSDTSSGFTLDPGLLQESVIVQNELGALKPSSWNRPLRMHSLLIVCREASPSRPQSALLSESSPGYL